MELFFSLQSLCLIFFLFSITLLIFLFGQDQEKPKSKTGLKTYPLVGNLPAFVKNRHQILEWITQVLAEQPTNTVYLRRPGNSKGVITANPINVEYMLKTNFDNYPKGDRVISHLEDFLGHGIFNSDGDLWKVQRKTASYEFNTKSFRNFVLDSVHHEIEERLLPLLEKTSKTGKTIDLQDVLERFAFDNVCKVAFNEDPMCLGNGDADGGELSPDFARSFDAAANLIAWRFRYTLPVFWRIKKFFNLGTEKQLKESIKIVHNFATKIIQSRMTDSSPPDDDLLSRFIANKDNSEEFLRNIVVSFIVAGRDTTSSSLAWFFWLISSRPHVEQKILEELKSVRSQSQNTGKTFSFEELREMHYLHASISEALRLYPPVAVDSKECRKDDVLPDGTVVRKGWTVTYNSYAMGRMESIWGTDCRNFLPERWLENGVFCPESPFRFPVFHAGPRICIGKDMAYIQMKSIAASVVERFEIDVLGKDTCPEHILSLTLRMKRGLPVQLRKRPTTSEPMQQTT